MPPGSLEMSLRSSASSAGTEIFVVAAIWRREIPRRSRASRSFPPKSVVTAVNLDTPIRTCQRVPQPGYRCPDVTRFRKEADGRNPGRAGRSHLRRSRLVEATDRENRQLHV